MKLIRLTLKLTVRGLNGIVKTVVMKVSIVRRRRPSVAVNVATVAGNVPGVSAKGPLAVQCPSSNFSRIEALT